MKTTIMIALLIAIAMSCMAVLPEEFNNQGHYLLLRMKDNSGTVSLLKNANIGMGTIQAENKAVPFNEVSKLEFKSGDKGVAGSIIGALVGCGIGAVVALSTVKTETEDLGWATQETTTIQLWPAYVIGFGGALVGWVMGKNSPKFTPLYDEGSLGSVPSHLDIYLADKTKF
ncbi:MAG: hypothetical protein RBS43_02795 [Candidatus Cloacimonas sp.]|nr:hypothetical protein [Candidatus Cloacimonas sp.]